MYKVASHYWLTLIDVNWTISMANLDYGFGNCIKCCQFHTLNNLYFSKNFKFDYFDSLGLLVTLLTNPNKHKQISMKLLEKPRFFWAMN